MNFLESEQENYKKEYYSFSAQVFTQTLWRILRYSGFKIISVILTVGLSLYLLLMILNLGGYVDEMMRGQIAETLGGMAMGGAFDGMEEEERDQYVEQLRFQMEEAMGLHQPLAIRTAR